MKKDWKIFTEYEIEERTKFWWDIIITPEFPGIPYPSFYHDRAKRRTRNLGTACRRDHEIGYSFRLYDGRFKLDFVDGVIKHEVLHHLEFLRYGDSVHNSRFKALLRKYDSVHMGHFINAPEITRFSSNPKFIKVVCIKCRTPSGIIEYTGDSRKVEEELKRKWNDKYITKCCHAGYELDYGNVKNCLK